MRKFLIFPWVGILLTGALLRAAPGVGIVIQEPWANVFGGQESVVHAVVSGEEPFDGQVGWQFAAAGRTLARKETAVSVVPGKPASVEIRIPVPDVKPGVVMETQLSVVVLRGGREVGRVEKTLWVFPAEAFAGRREWLKSLQIKLFDPAGQTAALFVAAGIPFAAVNSVDALSKVTAGVLVVGEGVSFKECRGLAENMFTVAATGVGVVCLAPGTGEFTLPAAGSGPRSAPAAMSFQQAGIITRLDQRLDAAGWAPDGNAVASSMTLRGARGPVLVEVGPAAGGWPWLELDYGRNNAKCILCGFAIVAKWADSPTPRFLLVKMLAEASGNKVCEETGDRQ